MIGKLAVVKREVWDIGKRPTAIEVRKIIGIAAVIWSKGTTILKNTCSSTKMLPKSRVDYWASSKLSYIVKSMI